MDIANLRKDSFRGKKKSDNQWAYGYPYITQDAHYELLSYSDKLKLEYFSSEIIPETLGQFTGVYDKTEWSSLSKAEQKKWRKHYNKEDWKGKPIFEGDIVKSGFYTYVVYYSNNHAAFLLREPGEEILARHISTHNLKVIGNRFDNPDLLEG